jgi:hypothetical protein
VAGCLAADSRNTAVLVAHALVCWLVPCPALCMGDGGPTWVEDSAHPACMLCGAEYWLFLRRHHCRACGKLVCWSCSQERRELSLVVAKGSGTGPQQQPGNPGTHYRVCTECVGAGVGGGEGEGEGGAPARQAKKGMPNALHVAASVGNICKLQFALEPLAEAAEALDPGNGRVPWEVDAGDQKRMTPFHLVR